ncbi:MAG: hypothetical protein Q7T21_08080 [Gallionella sp.]|nr:hypothetical protein [Gallionella sp.]
MKKISLLLISGLVAANFAAPVWAEHFTDYGAPKADHEKMEKMKSMMMGRHKMSGTVANIDHEKGMLTLKSSVPDMLLHFPPASIGDLKNGDAITVELGFSRQTVAK